MFAVMETGGKQYHVSVGNVIKIEKLSAAVGEEIEFCNVIMLNDRFGADALGGAKVIATVLEQRKTDKVIVFKKNRRHNYRRKKGHRQQILTVRITKIMDE